MHTLIMIDDRAASIELLSASLLLLLFGVITANLSIEINDRWQREVIQLAAAESAWHRQEVVAAQPHTEPIIGPEAGRHSELATKSYIALDVRATLSNTEVIYLIYYLITSRHYWRES